MNLDAKDDLVRGDGWKIEHGHYEPDATSLVWTKEVSPSAHRDLEAKQVESARCHLDLPNSHHPLTTSTSSTTTFTSTASNTSSTDHRHHCRAKRTSSGSATSRPPAAVVSSPSFPLTVVYHLAGSCSVKLGSRARRDAATTPLNSSTTRAGLVLIQARISEGPLLLPPKISSSTISILLQVPLGAVQLTSSPLVLHSNLIK